MTTDTKINLCYPCGFFRPGDAEDPIAGEFQNIDGAVWPKTAQLFWEKLRNLKNETVCAFSGGTLTEDGSIRIASLSENWRIDTRRREGHQITSGERGDMGRVGPATSLPGSRLPGERTESARKL